MGKNKTMKSRNVFHYDNTEYKYKNGDYTKRNVKIRGGKGSKTVSMYKKGKRVHSVKKPLSNVEITEIQMGKFIPGLFNDCKKCQ
jgi:5'-3' exonuclease